VASTLPQPPANCSAHTTAAHSSTMPPSSARAVDDLRRNRWPPLNRAELGTVRLAE
jgi:hypothetical protein